MLGFLEVCIAIAHSQSCALIRRPGEMSDRSFQRCQITIDIHRSRKGSLHQRRRLGVLEVLLVYIASVILRYAMFHWLEENIFNHSTRFLRTIIGIKNIVITE